MPRACFTMRKKIMEKRKSKIEAIHASDTFGIFIEAGCGLVVGNALMEVAGSSKTVYFAECPYSKDYQKAKYDVPDNIRSVSMEMVGHVAHYYRTAMVNYTFMNGVEPKEPVNFIYASSFQIGEYNDKATHGWICIFVKSKKTFFYFHVSIHDSLSRKAYLDKISQIGVDLIYHCTTEEDPYHTVPSNCCIDMIPILPDFGDLQSMFRSIRSEEKDNFICIKEQKLCRIEDLFRDQNVILLYKGSFNPFHNGHMEIAKQAEEKYGVKPVMVISSEVYQKGWIDTGEIEHRVMMLNKLGYSVIVTKDGFFNKNTEYIRQKFQKPIVYVVGTDTFNRILESSYKIINPDTADIIMDKIDGSKQNLGDLSKYFRKLAVEQFEEDFENVQFFVVNRPGTELKEGTELVKNFFTLVQEHPDFHHSSSTMIRSLMEKNDIEAVRDLMPAEIFEMYINNNKR
jgi:nicotinic acid mononucleotide adenylyltransferase